MILKRIHHKNADYLGPVDWSWILTYESETLEASVPGWVLGPEETVAKASQHAVSKSSESCLHSNLLLSKGKKKESKIRPNKIKIN